MKTMPPLNKLGCRKLQLLIKVTQGQSSALAPDCVLRSHPGGTLSPDGPHLKQGCSFQTRIHSPIKSTPQKNEKENLQKVDQHF